MNEHVPPNLRALRILEVLADSDTAMTPTELGAVLDWPKQTVHRLCQTLIEAGIVEKRDRRLYPGHRSNNLGAALAYQAAKHIGCHQLLLQVASEVGETVNFARAGAKGMNYVDRVETNWAFRVALPIGSHVPFHCTASGKLFMASLPKQRREALLSTLKLNYLTPNTFTEMSLLADELTAIRRQGYSLDREEFHQGMVAIAVPVTDAAGKFYAALAIHGPTPRFTIQSGFARLDFLRSYADRISDALFGNGSAE